MSNEIDDNGGVKLTCGRDVDTNEFYYKDNKFCC